MTDSQLSFTAILDADAITTAVLVSHAEYIAGTLRGTGWQCQSVGEKAHFTFASPEHRDRFVSFVWAVEHLRAEIFPSKVS